MFRPEMVSWYVCSTLKYIYLTAARVNYCYNPEETNGALDICLLCSEYACFDIINTWRILRYYILDLA